MQGWRLSEISATAVTDILKNDLFIFLDFEFESDLNYSVF
jgi:hypothetical protein